MTGLPPKHDLDAERVVLSSAMLVPEAADIVGALLTPAGVEFYSPAHREIWRACASLRSRNEPLDMTAVLGELRRRRFDDGTDGLEAIGGSQVLVSLCRDFPAIAHVEQHTQTVLRWYRVRRMQQTMRRLAAEADGEIDAEEWARRAEAEVYASAQQDHQDDDSAWYGQVFASAYDDAIDAHQGNRQRGIPTGFGRLDAHLDGMQHGDLFIVAGRPGQGKTSLVSGMVDYSAALGWGWLVLSLEMSRKKLRLRALARATGERAWSIRRGKLSETGWGRLAEAVEHYRKLPIKVDDSTRLTPSLLRSKLRLWLRELEKNHRGIRPAGVVIDHIQLTNDDDPKAHRGNRNNELGEVSRQCKCVAKDFGLVVLACSQLNRPPKGQKVGRPQLHDLRDTGSLEQDADVVVFVHRPSEYQDAAVQWPDPTELIVAKGRDAGSDTHHVLYDGPTTRFFEEQPEEVYDD